MNKLKREKGITLVALIITIIVLLILAVVAIGAVTGDGILAYAQNSVDEYEAGADKENAMLGNYLEKLEENVPGGSRGGTGDEVPTGEAIGTSGNVVKIGELVYVITDSINKTAKVYGYSGDEINYEGDITGGQAMTENEIIIEAKVKIEGEVYTVNEISKCAFGGSMGIGTQSITKVIIPDSITTIGVYAFSNCINLKEISIPNSIKRIANYSFNFCSGLERIVIPENINEIGYQAFGWCSALKEITLPKSLTSIEGWAFRSCENLETVNYTGTEEEWKNIIIESDSNGSLTTITPNYNYVIQ